MIWIKAVNQASTLIWHYNIMKILSALLILGLIFPALSSQAETVSITRQDCSRLIRHQPSPDIAYKPGLDAYGREVAPADLPGSGNQIKLLPEVLQFDIALNPMVGQSTQAALAAKGLDNTKMGVAAIHYDFGKNQFFINGQPLSGQELHELSEACAQAGVK